MDTDYHMDEYIDYLVVGQGLAGTMMAWHLYREGKRIMVVDDGKKSASLVAAGLFNPVTGRRFVKSWLIDDLLPYAESTYKDLEKLLNKKFFFQMPILKYLSGEEEKMVYEKSIQSDKQQYISQFNSSATGNQYSSCEIKGGGFVDTSMMILSFREFLVENGLFVAEKFSYNDLDTSAGVIKWKNCNVENVVFCEGAAAVDNPFFPALPFNLAKGEILTVKIPGLSADKILMAGGYLVPLGDDIFKIGSTYEWEDLSPVPTESGKEQLIEKLEKITDLTFEILDHEAVIRPAVKQRRPLLGRSAVNDKMYILNGLGTKGVILAPYFANQLTDYILRDKPIEKEVNIMYNA